MLISLPKNPNLPNTTLTYIQPPNAPTQISIHNKPAGASSCTALHPCFVFLWRSGAKIAILRPARRLSENESPTNPFVFGQTLGCSGIDPRGFWEKTLGGGRLSPTVQRNDADARGSFLLRRSAGMRSPPDDDSQQSFRGVGQYQ